MPTADLICLAILPVVVWASMAFVSRSTTAFASNLRAALSARTKQELIEAARSGALFAFLIFLTALIAVVAWTRIEGSDQLRAVLIPSHWTRGLLLGAVMGLALAGLLLILKSRFPQARRFALVVAAGITSPPLTRVSLLLFVVFVQELWRALCLNSMIADRVPGPQALIATSIAYGVTYLVWGPVASVSEGIVGAALGALYLWSGSLFVPLAAHVVLQAQLLLFAVAAAPDAAPGALNRRPFTKCPACGARLNLRQVNLRQHESFFCPRCHTRLTSSDRWRGFFRGGLAIVWVLILFVSWELFPDILRGTNYWITLTVIPLSGLGLSSIFLVVFPLKLEFGDPDFVRLRLGDNGPSAEAEKAAKPNPL